MLDTPGKHSQDFNRLGTQGKKYDEPLSSFFRNVDVRSDPPENLPVGDGCSSIKVCHSPFVA